MHLRNMAIVCTAKIARPVRSGKMQSAFFGLLIYLPEYIEHQSIVRQTELEGKQQLNNEIKRQETRHSVQAALAPM